MSLLSMLKGKGPSGFGYGSTAEDVTKGLDLTGRTILVTGCNSGIGKETLRVLAKRGAHVIAAARTVEKARAACDEVVGETTPIACELSDPASVKACAAQVIAFGRPLDAIICNAGIMALPKLNLQHKQKQPLLRELNNPLQLNNLLRKAKKNKPGHGKKVTTLETSPGLLQRVLLLLLQVCSILVSMLLTKSPDKNLIKFQNSKLITLKL